MKVVINSCFGGFCLSEEMEQRLKEMGSVFKSWCDIDRTDPNLVSLVESSDVYADTSGTQLRVVDVPDDVDWYIEEYDGAEHVAEKHRTWG